MNGQIIIETIARSAAKTVGSLWCATKSSHHESILQSYKTTFLARHVYCCYIWSGALAVYVGIFDKILRLISNIIGPYMAPRRIVATLCIFYK